MTTQPTGELRELYRELILDHARNPRHFGKLSPATHTAEGINPLCGDKLRLYLNVDEDDTIVDAAFEGTGCAISVASASLLTDCIVGQATASAVRQARIVADALTGRDHSASLGKLDALKGVSEYPSRVKCATLAWRALEAAVSGDARTTTTE